MPNSDRQMLLDTHVWYWLVNGDEGEFSSRSREAIMEADSSRLLRVSAISAWEIAMLVAKKRLTLQVDVQEWVRRTLAAAHGTMLTQLTVDILVASTRLPGSIHADPADRLIAATARALDATLVTTLPRVSSAPWRSEFANALQSQCG